MDLGLFVLLARKASCTMLELWDLSSSDPCGPCPPPGLDFLGVTGFVGISVMSFSPVVYFCSFL